MTQTLLQIATILALAAVGPIVVLTRDPRCQAMALTIYGLVLGFLFMLVAAPDVALTQFVVGAVALPILVLLTLARMRRHQPDEDELISEHSLINGQTDNGRPRPSPERASSTPGARQEDAGRTIDG